MFILKNINKFTIFLKKNSYHLISSQRDPLIHDDQAPSRVLIPVCSSNEERISVETEIHEHKNNINCDIKEKKQNKDLRENIGEALMYGISYDDTDYDYMQHLREVNKSPGTILLQAPTYQKSNVIQELPKILFPSEVEEKRNYQDQQSIPDSISGFQPDMDPELREVLKALDDDHYLSSDEDGDLDALINSGKVDDLNTFRNIDKDDSDSDVTIKTSKEVPDENSIYDDDFSSQIFKYKKNSRKLLSTTTYNSMSSSILPRSEALILLDDRFEKIEKEYNDDNINNEDLDEENSSQRIDFDSIMDDFLDNYEIVGKKMMPKISSKQFNTKHLKSIAELNEVRQQLGKTTI
ncbi:uncharacterized protein T551_03266 [Pneumocystis jirovecii RU7]|uniref:Protein LTV1 n=1 Tax=Pneumocystis jirovecii (strain RU7) TaxID=1408657 RepID=A0A0W4ZEK8_PNEJ7|nr:uncharacterized protein T551_03266 [Pneumocystis jirovecii RU7]KTW26804.1 hypothetical protein T551_03266 [Pneumocystis jirovecii RU7]